MMGCEQPPLGSLGWDSSSFEHQFGQDKLDFRWDLEETLPLSSVSLAGPRECCLCGDVATLECSECFKDKVFAATGLKQFCSSCSRQVFHGYSQNPPWKLSVG